MQQQASNGSGVGRERHPRSSSNLESFTRPGEKPSSMKKFSQQQQHMANLTVQQRRQSPSIGSMRSYGRVKGEELKQEVFTVAAGREEEEAWQQLPAEKNEVLHVDGDPSSHHVEGSEASRLEDAHAGSREGGWCHGDGWKQRTTDASIQQRGEWLNM
ncbi:hypothetical protein VIGAN_03061400 [Vigna angularis var. angularis]|uniref:Uncharacterized protein n=1 Tax=Vigna angularis var. angularis TaxID=157739 RepID=A0A0S3RK47_PHAAN|nr:hypothetical protein VIGAN_03061400 [Vigna angularis var. angularis]